MILSAFDLAILSNERRQIHALDSAAIGTASFSLIT